MQYSNFIMKNNVHATLSTALSSVATTIQLTTGQWARFWTEFPQIATLESFDDTWKVVKREIVQITARNDDDLTVVRAFAPCPANDDANSQSQSSVSFSADDQISLYIPKEIFDKILQSMNDIYDNGTNNMRTDIVSWLQVEVNPWSVLVWSAYYDFAGWTITLTDNATNYLEIDEDWNLANNTTGRNDENTKLAIITTASGSVTKIQDWRLWTVGWKIGGVNIHDLTEKASLSPDDELIISDSENIRQNKKIKASGLLGVGNSLAWENINKWDFLYVEWMGNVDWFDWVWYNTNVQKLAIQIIWNWENFDNIKLYLAKVGTPTNDLSIRIETDNNWEPSWNLIDANAFGSISQSGITTTMTQYTISLNWEINILQWVVCHLVLWFGTYDSANYYQIGGTKKDKTLFVVKQYDGSVWNNWTGYNNWYDVANRVNLSKVFHVANTWTRIEISQDWKYLAKTQLNSPVIIKYILWTAWDISTATDSGQSINVWANVYWVYIRKDWKQITVLDTNHVIHWYNLTTAWDFSTATQYGTFNIWWSTTTQGFSMSEDWLHFYVGVSSTTYQYNLSTPRDITTATQQAWGLWAWWTRTISLSEDWTKIIFGQDGLVRWYDLSTPRDITTSTSSIYEAIVNSRWVSFGNNWLYMYITKTNWDVDSYLVWENFGEKTLKNIQCDWIETTLVWKASAMDMSTTPIVPMSAVANFDIWNKVTYNLLQDNSKSWLTIWQKYYLSDTPWEIQTTAGTNEFEVWIAIEPTILKLKQTY